ncbi:MAG TPA: two-component regulator propeller domain-containing protein [Caulifigura sp.]|nr:two-component regulator propeller domain-containing protein [Caulifigura sp.]
MLERIAIGNCSRRHAVPVFRFALALVTLLVLSDRPALAINRDRALTQALLRKWQIQQGLPQPTITAITQTSDGALWLGTEAGLYRFDGVRFEEAAVIHGEPLDEIWVNELAEDLAGNLWIATRSRGLIMLRDGEVMRFESPVPFPMKQISCLLVAKNGDVWAGGEGGVARSHNGTFRRYGADDGLNIPVVRDMTQAADGTIWFGGNGEDLYSFLNDNFVARAPLHGRVVNSLLADRTGRIWAGTNRGLLHLEGAEAELTTYVALNQDPVEFVHETRDGTLWAGTRNGLVRLNSRQIERYGTRDGLTQSTVLTIFEDHEGSLWAGTKNGLNQFVDRMTMPLTTTEGLPTNEAGPIAQDSSGTVWIGTLGGGLCRYNGRRCEVAANKKMGLVGSGIRSLVAVPDGGLWVATAQGLCLWRDGKAVTTLERDDGLPTQEVSVIALDRAGLLWIGTPKGLFTYDGTVVARFEELVETPPVAVHSLLIGDKGEVIAATSRGVFQIKDRIATPLPGKAEWLRNVHAMHIGPDGEYWLAARGYGLLLIKGDQTTQFTIEDGLFDDEIVGIVRHEKRDELWFGCSRGIFSIHRHQLFDFAAGRRSELTSWSLSPTDALRTVECQRLAQPAVTSTADGRIWFSTIHGIIAVDPMKLDRKLPTPRVQITRLLVNGRPTSTHLPIEVKPGPLNLSIRYSANSYASPTRTLFRYRLDGFDKQWIEAGSRREAFYTNLSPGTYTFQVGALNPGEEWTDSLNAIELTLAASFWQTRWFPLAVGGLIGACVWGVLRLRVLRVRARLNTILAERTRIARELHDTLIQGFSGVTMQMQALSARFEDPAMRRAIGEVIQDAGACLREARQSVAGLRNSVGTSMGLSAAIEQTARQLTETRDVRLHLELPPRAPQLPVEVEFNLLRIAQEAIANAARHANARTIDVALRQHPGRLALRIHDDGIGFSVSDRERQPQSHYGLIGMRERSRQISADLTIESRPGGGTTILVDLPLASNDSTRGPVPTAQPMESMSHD